MKKAELLMELIKESTDRQKIEDNTIYKINEERYKEITRSILEIEPYLSSDNFTLQLLETRQNGYYLHLVLTAKKLTIREHLIINKLYYHFPTIKLFPLEDEFALHLYSKNLSLEHRSLGFGCMHWEFSSIQELCTELLNPRKVYYKAFTNHYEFKIISSHISDPHHVLKSLFCISDKVKISTGEYKDKKEVIMNFIIPKDYKDRIDYRVISPLKLGNQSFIHVDTFDLTRS